MHCDLHQGDMKKERLEQCQMRVRLAYESIVRITLEANSRQNSIEGIQGGEGGSRTVRREGGSAVEG